MHKFLKQHRKWVDHPKACIEFKDESKKHTSTQGSHAALFGSDDVASAIPVGGPRKLSQTSRNRDSSASLQFNEINNDFNNYYTLVCFHNGD